jgi:hypothetical protein
MPLLFLHFQRQRKRQLAIPTRFFQGLSYLHTSIQGPMMNSQIDSFRPQLTYTLLKFILTTQKSIFKRKIQLKPLFYSRTISHHHLRTSIHSCFSNDTSASLLRGLLGLEIPSNHPRVVGIALTMRIYQELISEDKTFITCSTKAASGLAPSNWTCSLTTVLGTPKTWYLLVRCGNSPALTMSAVTRSEATANL